jgi:hypothetical protein
LLIQIYNLIGHLKKRETGLDVNVMNLYYGGKQRSNMRSTIVTEACLGDENSGRTLNPGDVQHMNFQENDDILVWSGWRENGQHTQPKPPK